MNTNISIPKRSERYIISPEEDPKIFLNLALAIRDWDKIMKSNSI